MNTKDTIKTLTKYKITRPKLRVPASVLDTAGLLKDRYADLKRHMTKVRKEWK